MKRWVIIIAAVLIIISTYIFLTSQNKPTPTAAANAHLYFWSLTCAHCKNVADFLENWVHNNKITIDKREISKDRANSLLFINKSSGCGIAQEQAGVPLLITPEGKCLTGDILIIDYYKSLFPEASKSATISAIPNL